MKHESIRHDGVVSSLDLGRLTGNVTRFEGIRRAVAASYAGLLRRYPDINRANVLVDVYDMPGAAAVTWVFHTGDRVVSVLAQPYTRTYGAADFADPTINITK